MGIGLLFTERLITMIDIDVSDPDDVSKRLRRAVESFYESKSELQAAWQSKHAGYPWGIIASELDKAADAIDRRLENYYSKQRR
jgi:hypothetical protein